MRLRGPRCQSNLVLTSTHFVQLFYLNLFGWAARKLAPRHAVTTDKGPSGWPPPLLIHLAHVLHAHPANKPWAKCALANVNSRVNPHVIIQKLLLGACKLDSGGGQRGGGWAAISMGRAGLQPTRCIPCAARCHLGGPAGAKAVSMFI